MESASYQPNAPVLDQIANFEQRYIDQSGRFKRVAAALLLTTSLTSVVGIQEVLSQPDDCQQECIEPMVRNAIESAPLIVIPIEAKRPVVKPVTRKAAPKRATSPFVAKEAPKASNENDIYIPRRNMSYGEYQKHAKLFISKLPTLEQYHAMFPTSLSYVNTAEQKAFILGVDHNLSPTVEGYRALKIDETHNKSFKNHPSYNEIIKPRFGMLHWTVTTSYGSPAHFVKSMMSNPTNRKSVAYYIDDKPHHMIESDNHMTAHALGLNRLSQGIEIKAANLLDYDLPQLEYAVYTMVKMLRGLKIPVNETTMLGHGTADLLFNNPFYNPYTGRFKSIQGVNPSLYKQDPPQELMAVMVRKAMALDKQLRTS